VVNPLLAWTSRRRREECHLSFELTPGPEPQPAAPRTPAPQVTHVVEVAVPRPLFGTFSYSLSAEQAQSLRPGQAIQVKFGRKLTHAYVASSPIPVTDYRGSLEPEKLKAIEAVEPIVLPADLLDLGQWAAKYYHAPLGEVFQAMLPAAAMGLRSQKKQPRAIERKVFEPTPIELSSAQQRAFHGIRDAKQSTALLHGVTGSGKTEIYLMLIREQLKAGRSVVLMVPEIALTPQLHRRLEAGIGETVAMWHSALADGKRRDLWHAMHEGKIRVAVGARSAVFVPLKQVGLIIVDEEHEATYKQEERFRYHARDLALVRAKSAGAKVVLGSATPCLETLEAARTGKYYWSKLTERYSKRPLPRIETVQMNQAKVRHEAGIPVADAVIKSVRETLERGEQVLLFLNRRGFANFLQCDDCGEVVECSQCSVSMTVHHGGKHLKCHLCGEQRPAPSTCPSCKSYELKVSGGGTERLEEALPNWISNAKVVRLDRDQVTSTKRLEEILGSFRAGESNVLIGTQMLVKGHDFSGVTLVVVVNADSLFHWPDFRAPERALQTLTQVAGRAGRGEKPGRVMIQTRQPDHAVIQVLQSKLSIDDFLNEERSLRQELQYPPFGRLIRLRVDSAHRDDSRKPLEFVRDQLEAQLGGRIQVLGPSEAVVERIKNVYRWDLILKSTDLASLHQAARMARDWAVRHKVELSVDVDPQSMG
jgi:primosomal protein N' (replication factor Y)